MGLDPARLRSFGRSLRSLVFLPREPCFGCHGTCTKTAAGFTESLKPEARDLALTRNHLEHKYLRLDDHMWHGPRRKPGVVTALEDTLAFSVRRTRFRIPNHSALPISSFCVDLSCMFSTYLPSCATDKHFRTETIMSMSFLILMIIGSVSGYCPLQGRCLGSSYLSQIVVIVILRAFCEG